MRSTDEVIEHHLRCRREGDLDKDLRDNYADDVVLLSSEGVHRGHDGVRTLARVLDSYVSPSDYRYNGVVIEGAYALLRWSADGADVAVVDGVDSFVIRDDRIVVQTIHYSTSPKNVSAVGAEAL